MTTPLLHPPRFPFYNLREMINSTEWDYFISDRLGNDLFLSDPERADRIYSAAEHGGNGSTHAEHIQDWRDFLALYREYDPDYSERNTLCPGIIEFITEEIDASEAWHERNGSLYDEIG